MGVRGHFYVDEPEDDPLESIGPIVYASVGGGVAHIIGEHGEVPCTSAQSNLVPDPPAPPQPPDFVALNEGASHAAEVGDFGELPPPKPPSVYPTTRKGWEDVMKRDVRGRSGGGGGSRDTKPVFKPSQPIDESGEAPTGERIHVARLTYGEHQFYFRRRALLAYEVLIEGFEAVKRGEMPDEFPEPDRAIKTHDLFVDGFEAVHKQVLRTYPGLARRLLVAYARTHAGDWVAALDRVEAYRPGPGRRVSPTR